MRPLKASEIRGNWATLLLPINEDESIDFARLSDEIDFLVAAGVNGIYSNGTAGEFSAQTEEEFDRIQSLLAEKCERANMPFQIGASHMSPLISLSRVKRAAALKPSAIQIILPDWFPPTDEEAVVFLQRVAEAADPVGLVLYNPPHAKRILTPETFGKLAAAVPSLVGAKVVGGDDAWYAAMRKHMSTLSVFVAGHALASGFARGGAGAYSNMACLHPVGAQLWYERKTDLDEALHIEKGILTFMNTYILPLRQERGTIMSFIGIDLGTSFIKGAVLDLDGLHLSHIHRVPFPAPIPGLPPLYLYREFNPHDILAAVWDLLARLLPYAGECEGIVVCAQMHCLVFTTPEGEPRSNLTTWQDQRVLMPHPSGRGTYFDVITQRLNADDIRQTGNELRPGLSIGILFWLAEQGQLPPGDLIPASLPDFVLANLCHTAPSTDVSNGMAYGALNLETLDWHDGVIAKLGLDGLHWPVVRRHGEVVGHLPVDGKAIPCYTPVGDYQCALAGALLEFGELSLNISTGSQVSLLIPRREFGDYQTRPFYDGLFLKTITHIPAGRSLNALVSLLTELARAQGVELADPWPYIAHAAAEAGKTELRVNLAFFNSSCGDHGEITRIREEDLNVGHLFRAAFQSMADNYHACALRISPERAWQSLLFSGGLVQKIDVLRELICEKFGVAYRLCPTPEDTLLGLMVLALAFTGRSASVMDAIATLRAAADEGRSFVGTVN